MTIAPDLHHGEPCIRGTRVPVAVVIGTHAGILVLRPDEDGIRPQAELAAKVLSRYRLEDLAGTITVANPRGIRMRRPPERQGD